MIHRSRADQIARRIPGAAAVGLDPITANASVRMAREVIGGRQISYPVPHVLGILSVLCAVCLVIAMFATDAVRLVSLVLACGAFTLAATILIVGVFMKPELLRSEHHQQTMRLIDIVGDSDMDQASRARVITAIVAPGRARLNAGKGERNE
jgi:hypothetical protein